MKAPIKIVKDLAERILGIERTYSDLILTECFISRFDRLGGHEPQSDVLNGLGKCLKIRSYVLKVFKIRYRAVRCVIHILPFQLHLLYYADAEHIKARLKTVTYRLTELETCIPYLFAVSI